MVRFHYHPQTMLPDNQTRVYIYCTSVGYTEAQFEIPSWRPGYYFWLPLDAIPQDERCRIHVGFHSKIAVDITAGSSDNLNISDWNLFK